MKKLFSVVLALVLVVASPVAVAPAEVEAAEAASNL